MSQDDNRPDDDPDAEKPIKGPRDLPKRKMTLWQQGNFLSGLEARCKMRSGSEAGEWAGEATLTLTRDDMAALCCITDTIGLFDAYGAADYVKREVIRAAERKAKKK